MSMKNCALAGNCYNEICRKTGIHSYEHNESCHKGCTPPQAGPVT